MLNNLSVEDVIGFRQAFGPVAASACRVSLKGAIAVRTEHGYRAFDLNKKELVNVTDFCLDLGSLFYIWPTRKLTVGDIILFDGRFKCVTEVLDGTVKALDYSNSVIEELVPETHCIFGKTFYGRVTNLLGKQLTSSNKLIQLSLISKATGGTADSSALLPLMLLGKDTEDSDNGMMKMLLMSQLLTNGGDTSNLLPLLMMKNLGEGKDDDFGGMGRFLLLSQMTGNQTGGLDLSKILLMQSLADDRDLFGDLLGDEESGK